MVCAAMAVVASCYDDEPAGVPLERAEATLDRAFCQRIEACECPASVYASIDDCTDEVGVMVDNLMETQQRTGLAYDPSCFGEYVAALDERGCGGRSQPEAGCTRPCKPLHGDLRPGAQCTRADGFDDCAQGLVCEYVCEVEPCLERCVDPCLDTGQDDCGGHRCGAAEVCFYDEGGARCVTRPSAGMPCVQGVCADDSQCEFDPNTGEALCVARRELGEPCTGHRFCASGYCPAGFCAAVPGLHDDCAGARVCQAPYVCDVDSNTCEPPPPAICQEYFGEGVG